MAVDPSSIVSAGEIIAADEAREVNRQMMKQCVSL